MYANVINEDLRSVKTKKALYTAMYSLLASQSFRKITIKGICEEAFISRAAFYAHYIDKYDLLEQWIVKSWPKNFGSFDTYEQTEKAVNDHIRKYMVTIENLVYDADQETLAILFDYIRSTLNLTMEKNYGEGTNPRNIVLSNFYAGGFLSYLFWQIKNKFPPDVPPMNRHLYEMILEFQKWQSQ